MQLSASMGGTPLPLEGALLVGGIYLILPLGCVLLGLAMVFDSPQCARAVLLLAGFPLLVLLLMVAGYEPSEHEFDQAAQTGGRMGVCLYGLLTGAALWVLQSVRSPNVAVRNGEAEAG